MKANVKIAPEKRKDKDGQLITKNVPLFADFRFAGSRLFYFTGYRIDFDSFDFELQKVRDGKFAYYGKNKHTAKAINKKLLKVIVYKDDLEAATSISKEEIVSKLNDIFKKAEVKVEAKESQKDNSFYTVFNRYIEEHVSTSKERHAKNVMNYWRSFDPKITFDAVTVEKLREFEKYLEGSGTRGQNTIHSILKTSRAFWNWARTELKRDGIKIAYPFGDGFTLPGEVYGDPIYITSEERNFLFNHKFESEKLQRVCDIFVFQCLIGARVGDLCKLTRSNIQNGTLSYIQRKTKEGKPKVVSVPLHPMAVEILDRYDLPTGMLLPFITDQRYNNYLKDVFRVAGLDRIVTRLHPTTKIEEQVKLCDIVSSHMARRTFIGNLYGKVDVGVIVSMSGHVEDSKSFARYRKVSEELKQQAIKYI